MPIKTILALLETESAAMAVSKAAASLAKAFSAHLIGLHVVPNAYIPGAMPVELSGELLEAQRLAFDASAKRIFGIFETAIAGQDVAVEWRRADANYEPVASMVMRHGRECDLVVLGKPDQTITMIDGIAMTEEVMLGLGRPVFVVPAADTVSTAGKHVLLAWNGSREAARATFDALPFLQNAETVRILSAEPASRGGWLDIPDSNVATSGIAATLKRHGIRCDLVKPTAPEADVAIELLRDAKEHGCDLIVMGGYGHWRIREVIFGGTTRGVLELASIPILMSH